MPKHKSFPGFPNLKAGWVYVQGKGELKLIAVSRTSDGFLIGSAKNRKGEIVSNLFLGAARDH